MKEKEKEKIADTATQAIEEGLKTTDWSAEERYYNRSKRIRRKIFKWLWEHRGELYTTEESMAATCANYAGCSSVTARRWIHQFSQTNTPFYIHEHTNGYTIWLRIEMDRER